MNKKGNPGLVLAAFAVVYLVWGGTYLAIRIGLASFPPILFVGLRHILVGLLFFPIVWKTGARLTAAHWRTAILTGLMLQCVGNSSVALSEVRVPSGIAALLVSMASLWIVILDWLRPGGHRPGPRVIVGLILGFAGIVLLVGPKSVGGAGRTSLLGAGILAVGTFTWALGSTFSKHGALPDSPLLGVAMQSLCASIALWATSFFCGELHGFHWADVSVRAWCALGYLVVFGSLFGFTAYLYILKKSSATRVATYAFVNPLVALFLGWFGLGEAISLRTGLAAAVILTAVLLVISAPQVTELGPVDVG